MWTLFMAAAWMLSFFQASVAVGLSSEALLLL